jgi:hypothetical protein
MPKCAELRTLSNAIKWKFQRVDLENNILLTLKNHVRHDALKVICKQNSNANIILAILALGDMGNGKNFAKNREIALVFPAILANLAKCLPM